MLKLSIILFLFAFIAQSEIARLNIRRAGDWCATEFQQKRFTIVLNVGNIYAADGVYGIEAGIKYDNDKVIIRDILTATGTIFNQFEMKNTVHDSEDGYIQVSGAQISSQFIQVYGDSIVFAFYGEYKSACNDEAIFEIDYLYFTDKNAESIDKFTNMDRVETKITPEFELKNNYSLVVESLDGENLFIDSTSIVKIKVIKTFNANLNKFVLTGKIDSDKFRIINADINSIEGNISPVVLFDDSTISLNYELNSFVDVETDVDITLKALKYGEQNSNLSLNFQEINDCNCLGIINNIDLALESNLKDSTDTSIENEIAFESSTNLIDYLKYNNSFSEVEVLNRLCQTQAKEKISKIEETLNSLSNGLYFIKYNLGNETKIAKIILN